jgi:hypothetical protein
MREGYLNLLPATNLDRGLGRAPKSLFRNILHTSRCKSIFYPGSIRYLITNSLRINILENAKRKTCTDRSLNALPSHAKSLFPNILAISPYGSRFCRPIAPPLLRNSLKMNILEKESEKNRGAHTGKSRTASAQSAGKPRPLSCRPLLVSSGETHSTFRSSSIIAASY